MKIVELSREHDEPISRFFAELPDRDRTFLDDDVSAPHIVAALPARPGKRWVVVEETGGAEIAGFGVKAIAVSHTIDTSAFIVDKNGAAVAYSGDTGPTDRLWEVLNEQKDLRYRST